MTNHVENPNQSPVSDPHQDSTLEPNPDPKARRREQVRLAQRRRRAKLAEGQRTQVNIFLSPEAIARLDALTLLWGLERQEVIERLLSTVRVETAIPDIAL